MEQHQREQPEDEQDPGDDATDAGPAVELAHRLELVIDLRRDLGAGTERRERQARRLRTCRPARR
jgi:hypothetical protein